MIRYIGICALLVSFNRNPLKVQCSFVATNMSTYIKEGLKMRNKPVHYLTEKNGKKFSHCSDV
jgi:hypothetical protein